MLPLPTRSISWRPVPLWCAVLTLGWMAPLSAQKTDTVVIRNGDIITGEIKKLKGSGVLHLECRF